MRAETAVGEGCESQARAHGVHHVRTWARHGLGAISSAAARTAAMLELFEKDKELMVGVDLGLDYYCKLDFPDTVKPSPQVNEA